MRRTLIKQDAFDRIANESVKAAERELVEAESILAKALGTDHVSLHCFTESSVVYQTPDKTYVHAGYELKDGHITFNNIEELVIDESSRRQKRLSAISEMIDAVVVGNNHKAAAAFNTCMSTVRWDEAKGGFPFGKKGKGEDEDGDDKKSPFGKKGKKDKKNPFGKKDNPFGKKGKKGKDEGKKNHFFKKAKNAGKEMCEAYIVANNVLDYVDYMKVGPALAEAVAKNDDRGNVTDLRIPASRLRNESRLQRGDWKSLNSKVAESRKKIPHYSESQDFCKAVANLKRQNAFSDANGLQEALDFVVRRFPEVLFATQAELAQVIGESLEAAGVKNYDDQTCEFMSEGILRTAHSAYSEKVGQVLHLASASKADQGKDPYRFFQSVVEAFFPALDEKFGLERKVYTDLYESLVTVYKKADRQNDNAVKSEAASYLNELADVLNGKVRPELELASDAADYLGSVIETNLESGKWVVSNTPHLTVTGDHPDMAKKAKHGYTPASDFSGDWGDPLPAIGQDNPKYKGGKNAKAMRNDSWGQEGGGEVFPKLKNPYVPKPFGDYTMKPEKGVDKDNKDHALWSSGDTWPNLHNPYVPKEAGKAYKMKNGKDTDLVTDK